MSSLSLPQQLQPPSACTVAPDFKYSIATDSQAEIDRFKWIESERYGYDLGEAAIHRWVKDHWRGYLRARWLEHLEGNRYWIELDRGDFGLLKRGFGSDEELLHRIVDRLKVGQENLDVLCWAEANHIPTDPVCRILIALDINSRRLLHRFECIG